MFYYVDGTVTVLKQGLAVIDCGGVGYACHASQNTIGKLKIGTRARLLTYLNVREDIFELYGFIDEEEQSCFEMMIGVSGVGPKAALCYSFRRPAGPACPVHHHRGRENAHAGAGHRQKDRAAYCFGAAG